MRLVIPKTLTVTDTNIAASSYSEYSAGTYSLGDRVWTTEGNLIYEYESLADSNTSTLSDSTKWLKLGACNRDAMFDGRAGTKTTANGSVNLDESGYPAYDSGGTYNIGHAVVAIDGDDGLVHRYVSIDNGNIGNPLTDETKWNDNGVSYLSQIQVTVTPGVNFNTIALLGLDSVVSISIEVVNGVTTEFSETYDLTEPSFSWFQYYFDEFNIYQQKLIVDTSILYPTSEITVTLQGYSTIGCGLLMIGRQIELAETEYGASIGIEDYSTKETDEWGRTYLYERAYADTAKVNLVLPTPSVSGFKQILSKYRATPILYDFNNASSGHDSLRIYGKYDDFDVTIEHFSQSYCSMTVTGLL